MVNPPADWYAGQELDAETMQAEIHDQFADLTAGWTPYTPVWGATVTAPVLGTGGGLTGRYKLVGKMCTANWEQFMGPNTAFGSGAYTWSLPFPAASPSGTSANFAWMGAARAHGALWWTGAVAVVKGASTARIFGNGVSQEWNPSQPMTWTAATSQYLNAQVTYEIA